MTTTMAIPTDPVATVNVVLSDVFELFLGYNIISKALLNGEALSTASSAVVSAVARIMHIHLSSSFSRLHIDMHTAKANNPQPPDLYFPRHKRLGTVAETINST